MLSQQLLQLLCWLLQAVRLRCHLTCQRCPFLGLREQYSLCLARSGLLSRLLQLPQ
jgi:hypothetical protein